jgi:polar amino acid transport system substrate-binding protein
MKKAGVIWVIVSVFAFMLVNIAAAGTVMDRILQKKELVVGITGNQPPLNATTRDGKIIGLDADLARLIATKMDVKVNFKAMPFAKLLPALKAGQVDMILSSMTMTLERNLNVAFVGPYYISGKGILTKAQTIAMLQDTDGLNKPQFKVAALLNSTSQTFAQKAAPKAKLVTTKSYDEAVEMLLKDKVDAMVADYPFCAFTAFRNKENGLVAGQSKFTFEPLGIAVQEDALLINWLQNFMIMLEGSGQMKLLNKRWFQDASWVKELP